MNLVKILALYLSESLCNSRNQITCYKSAFTLPGATIPTSQSPSYPLIPSTFHRRTSKFFWYQCSRNNRACPDFRVHCGHISFSQVPHHCLHWVTLAARAGILDGKNAITNKTSSEWAISTGPSVHWIFHARWVVDRNSYITSGATAGIDGVFAFIEDVCV